MEGHNLIVGHSARSGHRRERQKRNKKQNQVKEKSGGNKAKIDKFSRRFHFFAFKACDELLHSKSPFAMIVLLYHKRRGLSTPSLQMSTYKQRKKAEGLSLDFLTI